VFLFLRVSENNFDSSKQKAARLKPKAAFERACRVGYFAIRYVRSPAAFLAESIFSPPLLLRMLTKPRTVCFCQPVASMISGRVAPLARFIKAITSAFLLAPDSVAPFAVRARREALVGDFFDRVRSVATGVGCGATSGDRRSITFQILATAAFRSVNFFTGFRSSKGATPAKLFQVSAKREAGHSAVSLPSSFGVENDCDSSALARGAP
jgi:hypothetical protein